MAAKTVAPNRRILLIDDNESIHQDFRKILNPVMPGKATLASAAAEIFGQTGSQLSEEEFEIDSAFQGEEGLEKVRKSLAENRPYALAFVDLRMPPGWDGIETISRIWSEYPDLQVVICTAYSDYSLGQIVGKLGRTDRMLILKKPFDAVEVLQFADALTEKWRLSLEARAKLEELEVLVAERTRELREEHRRLLEARKMELVGKLAGGIAHDFNSLLTAIIGHADLIRQVVPPGGLPFESAGEIEKSATCAATLTHQILAFSRKQMLKIEALDVNAVIGAAEPELRELLGNSIQASITLDAGSPWTRADAGQLRQVLISLAHNARDAMPAGGKLTLETADSTLDAADLAREPELSPGDYVLISITDTGSGIPDHVKPHLFEPYFTTKAPREGKGLSLAMCHGIVKQTGGHIAFRSELGRGATFKVYLPRFHKEQPADALVPPALPPSPPVRGTETILLVEADPTLRDLAAQVLEKQGYTVHRAAASREAIRIAGPLAGVDLLIADAVMPDMTGKELAEWLAASHPRMKALFTSAFHGEKAAAEGMLESADDLLPKPYNPAILCGKVRATLDDIPVQPAAANA